MKLAHVPLRVATGAYILNSGLSKQGLEGQAAEGVHGMASNAIPAGGGPRRAAATRTLPATSVRPDLIPTAPL